MGVVAFDYAAWEARYPEFAAVTEGTATLYFNEAELYLSNQAWSLVQNLTTRAMLLNMLTAHLAALYSGINGQPPSPLVGRISNASEGSVSVAVEMPMNPQSAWFNQTKYGAGFFAATAVYRTMRYTVPSRGYCGPFGGPFGIGYRPPGCW